MTIRVAINGYGSIGRAILRVWHENLEQYKGIEIKAINDLGKIDINAHLTRYNSTYGQFSGTVSIINQNMVIGGTQIQMLSEPSPDRLPWKALGIDLVLECTGRFTTRSQAEKHLLAGAKKVLISAPAKDVDATIVYGVNHTVLNTNHQIISNGSCTTNCLATVVKPLHEKLKIIQGFMTTIHAYTNDQSLLDGYHTDPYRARSATQSIIPTQTGAASAIGLVIPELAGKLDGLAIRVPTPNVSLVDLSFRATHPIDVKGLSQLLKKAAIQSPNRVLVYNEEPLVSTDFNRHPASAIIAAREIRVIGDLIKVLAWYDNEWGFSNRMLDIAKTWFEGQSTHLNV